MIAAPSPSQRNGPSRGTTAGAPEHALLDARDVALRFGGIAALDGVSLAVRPGTVCALIGPNGAGKTTLFNSVSGLYRPDAGSIRFGGRELLGRAPHEVARLGVARTFQNVALLPSLSLLENVMLGAYRDGHLGFARSALCRRRAQRREREVRARAMDVLDLLRLTAARDKRPDELPYGTIKRVELARALASNPELLMLDEPACGLNHEEVDALGALLLAVRASFALTILVVEHNMNLVRAVADEAYVLDTGRVIAHGTAESVSRDPRVIEAYLGTAS